MSLSWFGENIQNLVAASKIKQYTLHTLHVQLTPQLLTPLAKMIKLGYKQFTILVN